MMHWFASCLSFSASLSLMALMYAPESTRASILTELKSTGKKSIRFFFFSVIADISGM